MIQSLFADKNINLLHIKCNRGIYSELLFKRVIHGNPKVYTLDKLDWLKDFINHKNEQIATGAMEALCMHGINIEEFTEDIKNNLHRSLFSFKVIDIAEKQDKPDVLLLFLEENSKYMNRAILALKRKKHDNYLTILLLSNNPSLTKAIARITK